MNLTSVDQVKGEKHFDTLDLSGNNLTLSSDSFDDFPNITYLYLAENQLSSLPEGAFRYLSSLQQLYLNDNQLSSLSRGVFCKLNFLLELWLQRNQISSLPSGVFQGLSSLRVIYLQDNQLSSLPQAVFYGLSSLQELILNDNQLSSLPEGIFRYLSNLIKLFLLGKQMPTSLPEGIFRDFRRLEGVFMSYGIRDLDCGSLCYSLTKYPTTAFCYGKTLRAYCSLHYCLPSNYTNASAIEATGSGLGITRNNVTRYRASIVFCPAGKHVTLKYTYCSKENSLLTSERNCKDNNECAAKKHDCHVQAVCMNTDGSYSCLCNGGWTGDGRHCSDIDECSSGVNMCNTSRVKTSCNNTAGSYQCNCPPGYQHFTDKLTCHKLPTALTSPYLIGCVSAAGILLLGLIVAIIKYRRKVNFPIFSLGVRYNMFMADSSTRETPL